VLNQTVLVVDDEPVVRELLRAALKPVASRLLEAADGNQALELAWQERPDLVVLDVGLPMLNGMDVCRGLKTHLPAPRVILITANQFAEGIDSCGADAIVAKPFNPQGLLAEAQRLLAVQAA
jgi:DNA-binding response OmpR family regulator